MLKFKLHKSDHDKKPDMPEIQGQEMNEEVAAAIGLALHLHLKDIEDYEKTVLTIHQVMRPYSPWSSKIYGINLPPMKIPRYR
jgi:glutaconyl-CoA/methylmalonyl-CoA decarboxylase subunit delta